jgi:predicted AlkP superfamily pyrophosphatase or phosphodiesterase
MRQAIALVAALVMLLPAGAAAAGRDHDRDELTLVFVLDGLRPDSISAQETPNLYRLRREGVNFVNSHAAVPTVTRVNSTVLGTGAYPDTNGIVGNSMYVPAVGSSPFSTGESDQLLRLDSATGGRMLLTETLGERLARRGRRLVAIGSGSSGGTMLLNPRAPRGVGVMINAGDVSPTRPFAFPAEVGEEIRARFGDPPTTTGSAKVDYTEEVLREYVLPELRPDVVLNWLTEPDGTQHELGAGSPEARGVIRNDDLQIGLVLEALREQRLLDRTNILVVSDHGFSLHDFNVNLTQELIAAGLKESATSEDVVVANSGSSLVHVRNRDPVRVRAIVRFLQRQPWAGALYTAASDDRRRGVDPYGWVEGTFSLELIHHANAERGADIVVTYPWSSRPNAFGVPGTSGNAGGGATGPLPGPGSGHGSFSPWDIRNTFIAWGRDFRNGATSHVPAGNVDVASTVLDLAGLRNDTADGRVLSEGFDDRHRGRRPRVRTTTFRAAAGGGYRAAVQVSEVDGRYRYVDKSWRE